MAKGRAKSKAKPKSKPKSLKRAKFWRAFKVTLWVFVILGSILFVTASVLAYQYLEEAKKRIPELPTIMEDLLKTPSTILSDDGEILYSVSAEYRQPVPYEDIPNLIINTTIAAEDERYLDHNGVDWWAVGRVVKEMITGAEQTGGSTITMQMAKQVYNSPEQTLERKFRDMALAIQMERFLTKEQILELYLNYNFYGQRAYGIKAASDVYFGKELSELTLAEAALLARCVRRPSKENPITDPDEAIFNRNVVLGLMKNIALINEEEYQQAKTEPLKLREDRNETVSGYKDAPYFVDYVLQEIKSINETRVKSGLDPIELSSGGYKVETTINREYQAIAEEEVNLAIDENRSKRVSTGAFVLMDTDGRIRALVGGRDYNEDQYSLTWQGGRQPGSSFKPIVYATALDRGIVSPHGLVDNTKPYYYPRLTEREPLKEVRGGGDDDLVTVSQAIAGSYNRAAARVMEETGPNNVTNTARIAFGFTSRLGAYHSLVLGSSDVTMLEMAQAYSVFQLHGSRVEPYGITKIYGPNGQPIYTGSVKIRRGALSTKTAKNMDLLLRNAAQYGTGHRAARQAHNVRGKTGTTNENKDAWFCGYTDQFVGIMWLSNLVKENGKTTHQRMNNSAEGGKVSAPTWGKIMKRVQEISGEEARRFDIGYLGEVINLHEPEDLIETDEFGNPIIPPEDNPEFNIPPIEEGATVPPITSGGETSTEEESTETETNPPTEEVEFVFVEICADTGLISNRYCPERSVKRFRSGAAPTEECPVHGSH